MTFLVHEEVERSRGGVVCLKTLSRHSSGRIDENGGCENSIESNLVPSVYRSYALLLALTSSVV
jgi:hypothetical protein